MKLIVGLGNPGKKYDGTRHNVGYQVLNHLAAKFGDGTSRTKFAGRMMEAAIVGQRALLLWPETFMNLSGECVGPAIEFYKLDLSDLLVVCDDFNLPLGKLRFRREGSAGGQNGLADVIRRLGTEEFARLRLGIGPVPERWNAADFVLGRFEAAERNTVPEIVDRAAQAVECWATNDIQVAMNEYN